MYDVTSRESFENVRDVWLPELETYTTPKSTSMIKMIVGNKVDLRSDRKVSREEGLAFAQATGALFLECSAKTKVCVQQAFEELCFKIYETPVLWKKGAAAKEAQIDLASGGSNNDGACGC